MATKPLLSEDVLQEAKKSLMLAQNRKKKLIAQYKAEPKVEMYLSPQYRPFFGNVMTVSINGISIFFPVDGKTYKIPQTFADEITARRLNVDKIITRTGKMANVSANAEKSPGEIALF